MVKVQGLKLIGLLCLVVMVALVVAQSGRVAAWSEDPTVNTAICVTPWPKGLTRTISDGAGGAIVIWLDSRNIVWIDPSNSTGRSTIYAQRVDSSGTIQWTSDGLDIGVVAFSGDYQMVSDGLGGAIIVWSDDRDYYGSYTDIYAQRVDPNGTLKWAENGVAICTAPGRQVCHQVTSDGSGGAIIAWVDGRNIDANTSTGTQDIYAQKVDSSGTIQWTADGVSICTNIPYHQTNYESFHLVSDESGGAIITWKEDRSGDDTPNIYAQRVDSSGAVQWTLNGVAICTSPGCPWSTWMVSDGAGGAIITWYDYRGYSESPSTGSDIYAQRIDLNGTVQWATNGIAICTAQYDQIGGISISDGSGGAIIFWGDYRQYAGSLSACYHTYAQRVDSNGTALWIADGIDIGSQTVSQVTSDGSGGVITVCSVVAYDNGIRIEYDIYAQRVDSNGALKWIDNSVAICTAPTTQLYPDIISDGSGGALIVWTDLRNSTGGYPPISDVYAQRVHYNGSLNDNATLALSVTTKDASDIVATSARLNGDLLSLGTASSATISFMWGTSSGSYPNETTGQAMTTTGTFYFNLGSLSPTTTYYYRAKVIGDGTVYGVEKSFSTLGADTTPPLVATGDASYATTNSARLNGNLTFRGSASSASVSFEWGTSPGSYSEWDVGQDMTSTGLFYFDLTSLDPSITYYYRAKAVGDGTSYGAEKSFTLGRSPEVEDLDPDSGKRNQHLTVTISGTNFTGSTTVSFGSGITVEGFSINSSTEITAEITIDADATKGTRDVSVTTGWGTGTKTDGFSVVGGAGGVCSAGALATPGGPSEMTTTLAALGLLLGLGYLFARRSTRKRRASVQA